jgi:arylsulfatase A-like enzyme
MRRLLLLALLALAPTAQAAADDDPPAPKRPNIVIILADDLGWTDLGCQGSGYYETPNIDRLAARGMRFTDGYSCGPNCQPTRAALMSGQYGPRTGVYTVGATSRFDTSSRPLVPVENVQKLRPEVVTYAEALKAAGYATGLFGKWHLGDDPAHHPLAQGFDEALVSAGKHFGFETVPPVDVPEVAYHADFMTDRAVDFLERHKEGPFLLALHHYVVHSPFDAKPALIERFEAKAPAGGHRDPTYAAMIASLDESVGRVVAALEDLGIDGKTLVLFTSDNGGVGGYDRADSGLEGVEGITDNAPLRGGKGMLYEGGIRTPWIARWPGHIAEGSTCAAPILSVDLYPTLLDLAGAAPPDRAKQSLDGLSFLPFLITAGKAESPHEDLFWHFPGYLGQGRGRWRTTPAGAIRSGHFKLIEFFETGKTELYDLAADPGERHDLAGEQPGRAADLLARLRAWRELVAAPMPEPR